MVVLIFGLPADVVLAVTGAVEVPPAVRGAIWGYTMLTFVGLVVYGYTEWQYA